MDTIVSLCEQYLKESEYRRIVCIQEEKAKQILGREYEAVYNFFYQIIFEKKEFKYKFMRARRCQVLFLIFLPIIINNVKKEKEVLNVEGIFLSDNALPRYLKEIKAGAPTLIVDDILIHGRGIRAIYRMIDEKYSLDNIKVYVHRRSYDSSNLDKEFEKRLRWDLMDSESGWRQLSSQFVNLIYSCTVPYVSYISAYSGDQIADKNEFFKEQYFECINNTNDNRKKYNENSAVAFEKERLPEFFECFCDTCCLRLYTNTEIKKNTYIPFVFLKNIDLDEADNFIDYIENKLPADKFAAIKAELNYHSDISEKESVLVYKMRLIDALFSYFYSLYVASKYSIDMNSWKLDKIEMKVCFGEAIMEELCRIQYEDIEKIVNQNIDFELRQPKKFMEDAELMEHWWKIVQYENQADCSESDIKDCVVKYFYVNGEIDEERAAQRKERKKGITTGVFTDKTYKKNILIAAVLNTWDSGIASCNFAISEDKKIVGMYMAAGEQSFRYIIEKYAEKFGEVLHINREVILFNKPKDEAEKEIEKFINNEGTEEFRNFMKKNKNKLENWNIPAILNQ